MADLGFDGRVAIITGAGGGLGWEHAKLLASRGALLVINDLGASLDGSGASPVAEQRAAEIRGLGGEAVGNIDSVSTVEGGRAIVQTAIDAYGKVDIVVNNAGILRDKSFHNMEPAMVDTVIDVHLRGAFHVTQPAWLHMREQSYGRIVNTSSNSGILGNFGQANYGAAKMGLVGFTRVLAAEGAKRNIKVNALAPLARTRMTEDILGPFAEKLDPSQVSPVMAWLAHEDCPVSGEVFSAAGGRVARFFIGMTEGWTHPGQLTPEEVRDHFEEIRDPEGATIPAGPGDELNALLKALS